MDRVGIVGTGFVADLYMRSLATFPEIKVVKAYDIDAVRLAAFCNYWKVPAARSMADLLEGTEASTLILNLTNPSAHFRVSREALEAGKHVYSEKPLALDMASARQLCTLAQQKSLMIASAPCSLLSVAAQTLWLALRQEQIGKVRLVYAALDDDFIPQAPYRKWFSESGAPWPFRDEFLTGCTLEHAGYYLTWLIMMFGSVEKVVSASASLIDQKLGDDVVTAPDFACATLFFESGVVARLTCSIIAPHDHALQIFGDAGILEVDQSWNNQAAVRIRRRHVFRRRLFNSPFSKRVRIKGETHPNVKRWGAAAMNFALGPAEMLSAIKQSRPSRLTAEFALHLNEVTLAIQNGEGLQIMDTKSPKVAPMSWAGG